MAEINYATPQGQVRLLIADVSADVATQILTDAQIDALLTLEGDNVKRAAAAALDAIATSEVLVSKVIRTQDLTTDGAKVADALRRQAQALRDQASAVDDMDDDGIFDVVDTLSPGQTRPERTPYVVWGL